MISRKRDGADSGIPSSRQTFCGGYKRGSLLGQAPRRISEEEPMTPRGRRSTLDDDDDGDDDEDEIWRNCTSSMDSSDIPSIVVQRIKHQTSDDALTKPDRPRSNRRQTSDLSSASAGPKYQQEKHNSDLVISTDSGRRRHSQRPSFRRSRIHSVVASGTRGEVSFAGEGRDDAKSGNLLGNDLFGSRASLFTRGELSSIRDTRRGSTLHMDEATLKMAHLLHQRSFNLDDERIFGGDEGVGNEVVSRATLSRKVVEQVSQRTDDLWWNLREMILHKFGNLEKAFETMMGTGNKHFFNLADFTQIYLGLYEHTPEGEESEPWELEQTAEELFEMLASVKSGEEMNDYVSDDVNGEGSAKVERTVEFRQLAMRLAGVGEKMIRSMRNGILRQYGSLDQALSATSKDRPDFKKAFNIEAFTTWFAKVIGASANQNVVNQAKKAFQAFDVDNSGSITVTELQRGLAAAAPFAFFSQFKRQTLLLYGSFEKFQQVEKARWPQWSEPLSSEIVESISFHYDINPRQTQDFLRRVGVISEAPAIGLELELYIDKFGPEEFAVLLFLHKEDHEVPERLIMEVIGSSSDGEKAMSVSDFSWRFFGVDVDGCTNTTFEDIGVSSTVEEDGLNTSPQQPTSPKLERDRFASPPSPAPSFRAGVRATVAAKRFSCFNKLPEKAVRSFLPLGRSLNVTEAQELYDRIEDQMGRVTPMAIIRSITNVSDVLCCDRRMYQPGQRAIVRYKIGAGRQHEVAYRPFVAIVSRMLTYIHAGSGGWYLGNKPVHEFGPEAQSTEISGKKEGVLTFTIPFPSTPHELFEFRLFSSTSGRLPGRQIGGAASFDVTYPGVERPDIDRMCLDQMNETSSVVVTWNLPEFEMYQGVRVHDYVIKAIPRLLDLDHTIRAEDLTEVSVWSPQRKGVEEKLSYEFKGLNRGVNYEFRIQPIYKRFSHKGGKVVIFPGTLSPKSKVVESPYCQPSGAPGVVYIERQTIDELDLCFAPPEEKGLAEVHDYEIQSFRLRNKDDIVEEADNEDSELWEEIVERKVRMRPRYSEQHQFWVVTCVLSNMPKEGCYHVFRAIAVNEAGRSQPSPISEPVFLPEKQESPNAPGKLHVDCLIMKNVVDGKSRWQRAQLRATWDAPETDNIRVPPVIGYEMVVAPADSVLRNEGWQPVTLYCLPSTEASAEDNAAVSSVALEDNIVALRNVPHRAEAIIRLPIPIEDSRPCVFKLRARNVIGKSAYSENCEVLPPVTPFAPPPVFTKPEVAFVDPMTCQLTLHLQNAENLITGIKVSYASALKSSIGVWEPWADKPATDVWFNEVERNRYVVRVTGIDLVERNYLFRVAAKSRDGERGIFSEDSDTLQLNLQTLYPRVSNAIVQMLPVGQFGIPALLQFDVQCEVSDCDVEVKASGDTTWQPVRSFVFQSIGKNGVYCGVTKVGLVDLVKPQTGSIVCRVNASNLYGSSGWVETEPLDSRSQDESALGDLPQPGNVKCSCANIRKAIHRFSGTNDSAGTVAFNFDLEWDRVRLADGYEVQLQRGLASSKWQPLRVFIETLDDRIRSRAEIVDGSVLDTLVRFRVRATRCGVTGPWSVGSESVNFENKTPPKPKIAAVKHTNCVALQLNKVPSMIVGYRLERQQHSVKGAPSGWRVWPFWQCAEPDSGCVYLMCPLTLPEGDAASSEPPSSGGEIFFRVAYHLESGWSKASPPTSPGASLWGVPDMEDLAVVQPLPLGALVSFVYTPAPAAVRNLLVDFPAWWQCLQARKELDVTCVLEDSGTEVPVLVHSCAKKDVVEEDLDVLLKSSKLAPPKNCCIMSCFIRHEWTVEQIRRNEVAVQLRSDYANSQSHNSDTQKHPPKQHSLCIPMSFRRPAPNGAIVPNCEDIHIYYDFDGSSCVTVREEFDVDITIVTINEFGENVEVSIEEFENAGHPVAFSVMPDLPEGLEIDEDTGSITGSPEQTKDPTTYVIKMRVESINATITTVLHFGIVSEIIGELQRVVQNLPETAINTLMFILRCDAILHLVSTLQQNPQPIIAAITFNRVLSNEKLFAMISETPDDDLLRQRALSRMPSRNVPSTINPGRRTSVAATDRRLSISMTADSHLKVKAFEGESTAITPAGTVNGQAPGGTSTREGKTSVAVSRKESSVSSLPKFIPAAKRRYTRSHSVAEVFDTRKETVLFPPLEEVSAVQCDSGSATSSADTSSSESEAEEEPSPSVFGRDHMSHVRERERSLLQPLCRPMYMRKRSTSMTEEDVFGQNRFLHSDRKMANDHRQSKVAAQNNQISTDAENTGPLSMALLADAANRVSGRPQELQAGAKRESGSGGNLQRRGSGGRRFSNFGSLDAVHLSQNRRPSFLNTEEGESGRTTEVHRRRSRVQGDKPDSRISAVDLDAIDRKMQALKTIQRLEFQYSNFVPRFFVVNEPILERFVPTVTAFDFDDCEIKDLNNLNARVHFTVSPPLIPDIVINSTTGVISGKPLRVFAEASYTIICRAMTTVNEENKVLAQTSLIINFAIVNAMTASLWANPRRFMVGQNITRTLMHRQRKVRKRKDVLSRKGAKTRASESPDRCGNSSSTVGRPNPRATEFHYIKSPVAQELRSGRTPRRKKAALVSSSLRFSGLQNEGVTFNESDTSTQTLPFKVNSMFEPSAPECCTGPLLLGFPFV